MEGQLGKASTEGSVGAVVLTAGKDISPTSKTAVLGAGTGFFRPDEQEVVVGATGGAPSAAVVVLYSHFFGRFLYRLCRSG